MKRRIDFWLPSAIALCCLVASSRAIAQVVPDATLPNNSNVASEGNTNTINGGTRAGSNLFHSFEQFSVPTGSTANFNNALDVQNIITRVTGKSISNIDGLIKANGSANLFLINPNGFVFGSNASLNIGGSFIGSTANSINFANGFQFSATAAEPAPLLTISVPSGLQFGTNPGEIQVQSNIPPFKPSSYYSDIYYPLLQLNNTTFGLRVQSNQTLALVGGDVSLEMATLKTAGGRIELGSVGDNSLVSLTPINKGFSLGYDAVQDSGNIRLSQQSAVDTTGTGGGDIQIWGRHVTVTDGSQIQASTLGAEQGGNIAINAQDSVQLTGEYIDWRYPSSLNTRVYPGATGAAGDLTINTRELLVRNGAEVITETNGRGNGGNLTVNAGSVQLVDRGRVNTGTNGRGNGGNLTVNADSVQLVDGGLYTFTDSAGFTAGSGGNLTINTRELLAQERAYKRAFISAKTGAPPGIVAAKGGDLTINASKVHLIGAVDVETVTTGSASAGQLTVKADSVLVQDGARMGVFQSQDKGQAAFSRAASEGKESSLTVTAQDVQLVGISADGQQRSRLFTSTNQYSSSDAGSLTINTNTLLVKDGAQVSAATSGEGKGGSLAVNAQDVQLIGASADGKFRSGLYASTQPKSIRDAGKLTVKTNTLLVRDGARVTVESLGTGTAGNITLNARSIRLSNNALLNANTRSTKADPISEQATININTRDLIMSHNSNIRTNATGENVIGGNINIDTDFLVAAQDSNISSDAQATFGGRIIIDTQGIFRTADSDFTASSELGTQFNGTVDINTPGIKPNSGLINLPVQLVEARVAQTCKPSRNQAQSEFVVIGRGGLPPNPGDVLNTDAVQVDLVTLNPEAENRSSPAIFTNPTSSMPDPIVEAQGWVIGKNGEVVLTATAFNVTPHSSWYSAADCHAFQIGS